MELVNVIVTSVVTALLSVVGALFGAVKILGTNGNGKKKQQGNNNPTNFNNHFSDISRDHTEMKGYLSELIRTLQRIEDKIDGYK